MGNEKGGLLFLIFIFVGIVSVNSFFVSAYISPISLTGLTSSEADLSLTISVSQAINVIRDDFNGDTTSFTHGNLALETLTGMTLERVGYGKLVFGGVINLTKNVYNPTGSMYERIVDIDSNLQISKNYIYVNSGNLSSLNKSVTVTFYKVGYTSPKILRDDVDCPASVCTLVSYSGGTAVFTISYFESNSTTEYMLTESSTSSSSSSSTSSSSSGGGGGGGGGTIAGRNVTNGTSSAFYVSPNTISANIEKGKSYVQKVTVYNRGSRDLTISVSPSLSISSFLQISEKTFVLKVGESKVYNFYVSASARSKADLYAGTLTFSAGDIKAIVSVAIGVQELPALFDMKVTSTKKYVLPGGLVSGEVRISNIGDAESVKAVLEYGVMGFDNLVYSSRKVNIVVTKDILLEKISLKLPEDISIGRYIIYTKITYEGKIAVSNDTFQVERISVMIWVISIIMILILLILVIFAILLVNKRRREKEYERLVKESNKPVPKKENTADLIKDLLKEIGKK